MANEECQKQNATLPIVKSIRENHDIFDRQEVGTLNAPLFFRNYIIVFLGRAINIWINSCNFNVQ